ncbi:holo-[acyl-carrier protein] synthase [Thiohalorhabdus denitrificans]|uniref:Holo-[acyl-carrier-protein] synthase n=2 Tax=Thiohalorhabdus denitrificans TaxID=381306 RepID=A0A1G5GXY8_9GAMM|nr:holo-[acyl-carrier protein] synthase [Thiohalorhabdus denitrificans]
MGNDLVDVRRIRRALERNGDRLLRRLFTEEERQAAGERKDLGLYVASRFAAKEAAAKALGTGIHQGVRFRDLEVRRAPGRPPELHLHGRAADHGRHLGVLRSHLSLSDEGDYALATVILEG